MINDLHQRVLAYVHSRVAAIPSTHVPNAEVAAALNLTEESVRTVRAALLNEGLVARIFGGFTLTPQGLKAAKLVAV